MDLFANLVPMGVAVVGVAIFAIFLGEGAI